MTWLGSGTVDGSKSVKDNRPRINGSFGYTETSMQKDHFWDDANSNLDGRHQFAQMPKFESGGSPDDPTLATDMDLVYYSKEKTSTEAPDLQVVEPFAKMNDGTNNQVMQLGFRAMVNFDVDPNTKAVTIKYSHNVASVSRTATGVYTVNFSTNLPTNNYIPFGTAIRNVATSSSSSELAVTVRKNTLKASTQAQGFVILAIYDVNNGQLVDPLSGSLAICGG